MAIDYAAATDDELIEACRAGEARAWERVLAKYERLVFSIPLNCGLSREDAADITQYTFTHLLQSLDGLYQQTNLGAWLATVARRTAWRTVQRTQREGASALEQLPEQAGEEGDQFERWAQLEWLNAGLAKLDPRCRDLLIALYFAPQEPSYAEIAARTGMAIGSIGPTRARCLERMRKLLGER